MSLDLALIIRSNFAPIVFSTVIVSTSFGCKARSNDSHSRAKNKPGNNIESPDSLDRYTNGGADIHRTPRHERHWGYTSQGGGFNIIPPERWADQYETCGSGERQSPIELSQNSAAFEQSSQGGLVFEWTDGASKFNFVNNRHTVQGTVTPESETYQLKFDGDVYKLRQFHYHKKSEHWINGKQFDYEVHFVHESVTNPGHFAVVGVVAHRLIGEGESEFTRFLMPLSSIAAQRNEELRYQPTTLRVPISKVLPNHFSGKGVYTGDFYNYHGSLTTPPCTESVKWIVLADPIYLSAKDIDSIQKARFDITFENSRQPAFKPGNAHGLKFFRR